MYSKDVFQAFIEKHDCECDSVGILRENSMTLLCLCKRMSELIK